MSHHSRLLSSSSPIVYLFLLGLLLSSGVVSAQNRCEQEVAEIKSYCRKIDRSIDKKQQTKRLFARTGRDTAAGPADWREFNTEGEAKVRHEGDNLDANASVWLSQGRPVGAKFTYRMSSGEGIHQVMYYYRDEGTLAKIGSELHSSDGRIKVVREQFYDPNGLLLRSSTQLCTVRTGKATKPEEQKPGEPIQVYLRNEDLPFFNLLK